MPDNSSTIRHRREAEPYGTKDTSTIRELAHPSNIAARHQSLAEATLAPGQATLAHFHRQSEEIYYILSGRAEVRLGMDASTCEAGAAIVIAPGVTHQIRNVGPEDLVFLCACAPPYSHEDTFFEEAPRQDEAS